MTVAREVRADGEVLAVKSCRDAASYANELAARERLHGIVPVPAIVDRDDARRVLAYRWIEGPSLDELWRSEPAAVVELAGSLGKLLARLATVAPLDGAPRVAAPTAAQLAGGPARERLGAELADAMAGLLLAPLPGDDRTCLVHGDFAGRNILVRRAARWRLAGVIDWEFARAGSPLDDLGTLLAEPAATSAAFRDELARGYRAGRGELAATWWRDARVVHARTLVEVLASPGELAPQVVEYVRAQVARVAAELC